MGKIWMPGGGGGTDLDVVTVTDPWDVAAGKVIMDKDGNPLTGTLTDRPGWTGSVGMNGSIAIPAGRHNGAGKVNGPAVTQRGAWTGSVGMNGAVAVPEGYHSGGGKVNGPAVTQRGAWTGRIGVNGKAAIPEGYHNGSGYVDQSIPTQGWNYLTPTTYNQVVCSAGRYVSGDQGVYGDPNLIPANIAKDRVIFGVKGTAAVYGMDPMYFFNNGVWSNLQTPGMSGASTSGSVIVIPGAQSLNEMKMRLNQTVDLTAYKFLKVSGRVPSASRNNSYFIIGVSTRTNENTFGYGGITTYRVSKHSSNDFGTSILDISSMSGFYYIYVGEFMNVDKNGNGTYASGEINQILLSAT